MLLSKLLTHKESRGDMQGAALVKQASPVAWQHVNLYGRYEFGLPLGSRTLAYVLVHNVEFIVMPTKVVSLVIRLGQIEIVGLMYSALS